MHRSECNPVLIGDVLVPEPDSFALVGIALVGLIVLQIARRRRSSTSVEPAPSLYGKRSGGPV